LAPYSDRILMIVEWPRPDSIQGAICAHSYIGELLPDAVQGLRLSGGAKGSGLYPVVTRVGKLGGLRNDADLDSGHAGSDHAKAVRGFAGVVDDAPPDKGPAIRALKPRISASDLLRPE
jgi:hypothetical protein